MDGAERLFSKFQLVLWGKKILGKIHMDLSQFWYKKLQKLITNLMPQSEIWRQLFCYLSGMLRKTKISSSWFCSVNIELGMFLPQYVQYEFFQVLQLIFFSSKVAFYILGPCCPYKFVKSGIPITQLHILVWCDYTLFLYVQNLSKVQTKVFIFGQIREIAEIQMPVWMRRFIFSCIGVSQSVLMRACQTWRSRSHFLPTWCDYVCSPIASVMYFPPTYQKKFI